jgi:hypothetical protein
MHPLIPPLRQPGIKRQYHLFEQTIIDPGQQIDAKPSRNILDSLRSLNLPVSKKSGRQNQAA